MTKALQKCHSTQLFRNRRTPKGTPWMSTLAYGYHEDRTLPHGYEPTREAAMAAFAMAAGIGPPPRPLGGGTQAIACRPARVANQMARLEA
jgi:hypothetical protein